MSRKYMKNENDVYFLGSKESSDKKSSTRRLWIIASIVIVVVAFILILIFALRSKTADYYFEPETTDFKALEPLVGSGLIKQGLTKGYIEVLEETVNDVPLFVYVPHEAEMSLSIGRPNKSDASIIFITQAADIRGDNFEIVGDFVMKGQQLSKGVAKAGFCAVIDSKVTIGVTDNTSLLQEAINKGGYFFRQYPLVHDGELVENNPKNKSIRRALCIRSDKVIIVESRSSESFHDFSQALIDIGVSDAIYLVGTNTAFGWYYNKDHQKIEFGVEQENLPQNTSYILWKTK